MKYNPLIPSPSLLTKLGSIIVHQQELHSSSGHYVDEVSLNALLSDDEVKMWMEEMGKRALLPLKRE
jgi:hypothetical protein